MKETGEGPPPRDCPHGHKLGKCDSCDLIVAEKRIADLEKALKEMLDEGISMDAVRDIANDALEKGAAP